MQTIKIRSAERKDCPAMMDLIRELAQFEKAPEEVTVTMEEFEDAGFGENPVWEALLAESQGEVVGMALFYIRYSTWKGRRLYLEDLVVREAMRGKGVGTQLFEALWELVRTRKYAGMVWQVLDWNEPAIQFYQKYSAKFDGAWLNVSREL